MDNSNGTDSFGFDDNLVGWMNKEWWWIIDGKSNEIYQKLFSECIRKEIVIGGGDIKEEECLLVRRGY